MGKNRALATLLAVVLAAGLNPTVAFAAPEAEVPGQDQEAASAEVRATSLPLNAQVQETVQGEGSEYSFVLDKPGVVRITLSGTEGTFNYSLRNASDTFYDTWRANFNSSNSKSATYDIGLPAGTYYVSVAHTWDYDPFEVGIRVDYEARADFEMEPNQTKAMANNIKVNKQYTANAFEYDDKDYFKFTLDRPGKVNLVFGCAASVNNAIWNYTIENETGTVATTWRYHSNTENADVVSPSIGLEAGTYYVVVNGPTNSQENYHFTVQYEARTDWESELNNGAVVADPIATDVTYGGSSVNSNDIDYFTFTLPSQASVRLSMSSAYRQVSYYWPVTLYDASEEMILSWRYHMNTGYEASSDWVVLPAGTYYVSVGGAWESIDYQLRVDTSMDYGFPDVTPGDWYANSAVLGYALDHGIMRGFDDGTFRPYDSVTRGQVATMLHRIAGEPTATSDRFSDVNYNEYYGKAIMWARATGVISGYDGTNEFRPERPVTREELCKMLENYAINVAHDYTPSDGAVLSQIAGNEYVSTWARSAVAWAAENGILTGEVVDGVAYVNPQNQTWRCAAAKMMSVFHRDVLNLG